MAFECWFSRNSYLAVMSNYYTCRTLTSICSTQLHTFAQSIPQIFSVFHFFPLNPVEQYEEWFWGSDLRIFQYVLSTKQPLSGIPQNNQQCGQWYSFSIEGQQLKVGKIPGNRKSNKELYTHTSVSHAPSQLSSQLNIGHIKDWCHLLIIQKAKVDLNWLFCHVENIYIYVVLYECMKYLSMNGCMVSQ